MRLAVMSWFPSGMRHAVPSTVTWSPDLQPAVLHAGPVEINEIARIEDDSVGQAVPGVIDSFHRCLHRNILLVARLSENQRLAVCPVEDHQLVNRVRLASAFHPLRRDHGLDVLLDAPHDGEADLGRHVDLNGPAVGVQQKPLDHSLGTEVELSKDPVECLERALGRAPAFFECFSSACGRCGWALPPVALLLTYASPWCDPHSAEIGKTD